MSFACPQSRTFVRSRRLLQNRHRREETMRHQFHICRTQVSFRSVVRPLKRSRAHAASTDVGACDVLKNEIRSTIQDSSWGTSARKRISELQVALEESASELDYEKVQGLWRLTYTTAPDVVPLMLDQKLSAPRLPWQPRVSSIYQRFTTEDEGIVQNIVQFGDGILFDKQKGGTFVVNASWFKSSGCDRTIELIFESAQFDIRIPLPTASNIGRSSSTVTGKYKLTYCDEDMLVGRAQVGGGVFIFEKADESFLW